MTSREAKVCRLPCHVYHSSCAAPWPDPSCARRVTAPVPHRRRVAGFGAGSWIELDRAPQCSYHPATFDIDATRGHHRPLSCSARGHHRALARAAPRHPLCRGRTMDPPSNGAGWLGHLAIANPLGIRLLPSQVQGLFWLVVPHYFSVHFATALVNETRHIL